MQRTFAHLHICVLKRHSCAVHICTFAHLHTCMPKGTVVQCSALRHFPFSPLLLNQPTNILTLFAAALRKGFLQILNKKKLSKLHKKNYPGNIHTHTCKELKIRNVFFTHSVYSLLCGFCFLFNRECRKGQPSLISVLIFYCSFFSCFDL